MEYPSDTCFGILTRLRVIVFLLSGISLVRNSIERLNFSTTCRDGQNPSRIFSPLRLSCSPRSGPQTSGRITTLDIIQNSSFLYPFLVAFSFLVLSSQLLFFRFFVRFIRFFFSQFVQFSHLALFYHLSSWNMLLCGVHTEVFGFHLAFSIGIYKNI